ncbi:glycosyltransferase [Candidatus Microgenomates bacterium]|nr:glycosyltransferase [Candidatus Microgenomates bacterium]
MNTKSSPTDAVIIIPTYTNTAGLKDVLSCNKTYGNYRVIVVNNNPINSLNDLPEIEVSDILTEPKNAGFAKACNDGAGEATTKYHPRYLVFLNDDVTYATDWIKTCIGEMKTHKWSATVPRLIRPDGTIENVGYIIKKNGRTKLLTEPSKGGPDGITAAALVIDTDTFKELDGFDESFFAYLEDVDLCLRMTKAGKTFGVTHSAAVTHMGQRTSSKMSQKKAMLDFKNWIKLIARHWSREEKLKYLPQIAIERLRNLSGVIKSV